MVFYDVIIIGGGISGLYTAYQLNKINPSLKVILFESYKIFGGRVYTYNDKHMTVDAGAGRFSDSHSYLIKLINELGLKNKIELITNNVVYAPSDGTHSIQSSILDAPTNENASILQTYIDPIYNSLLDVGLGTQNIPSSGMITKVILASKFESREYLQTMTFIQYASKILSKKEIQYIKDTFGYYSELIIMNAYDAIYLMNHLGPMNQFYILKGGLSQIIEGMVNSITKNANFKIYTGKKVDDIKHIVGEMGGTGFDVVLENGNIYRGKKCICAIPRPSLEKFTIFRPMENILKKIKCGSLCRIYSVFEPDEHGNVWFKKLPKFTTNNNLRMIIPIDEKKGVVMISYSDNIFAKYWKNLHDTEGIRSVNKKLKEYIFESLGIHIPMPKYTKLFYWSCGVGYWGVGANSHEISNQIIQPFDNMDLFVCGENYSENNQQWMEGALETSKRVIDIVLK
jgi:monoamine oxidase